MITKCDRLAKIVEKIVMGEHADRESVPPLLAKISKVVEASQDLKEHGIKSFNVNLGGGTKRKRK